MDEKTYLSLLENCYSELPEVAKISSRFEIPKAKGRIVKSRTIMTNFLSISKKFERDKNHFFRFMIKEGGVRGEIDDSENLTLHSKFNPEFLNKCINKYFKEYVECENCHSPDTVLEDNNSKIKCSACGNVSNIKII